MAKIIHELRLFLWAIGLPAVIVVAGGIRLLVISWRTNWTEARAELLAKAEEHVGFLLDEAEKRGFGAHRPPHDSPRRGNPPPPPDGARQHDAPPHRWRGEMLDALPEICDAVHAAHKSQRGHCSYAVLDMDGAPLYVTDDYPAASDIAAEVHLPPPFGESSLRVVPSDGGASVRARAFRLLALGAAFLALLVCTLSAGGLLLVHGIRRERRDARRKTDFIDNVSHELRTPLAGIRLNAELLSEARISDPAKRQGAIDAIITESDRLSRMVSELLDFSRLEKGTRRYEMESFDLSAFVAEDSERQAIAAISKGRAQVVFRGTGAMVTADKDAVRQIGVNLVTNAAKYSTDAIDIEVEGPVIRYMDRGPGIPPGSEEKIFERFYRVDNSLTQTTSGMGVGLPIARALARGMGGDLAYSPRPGGGSVFTLTLKADDSSTQPTTATKGKETT